MSTPSTEALRSALASGRAADALRAEVAEATSGTDLVEVQIGGSPLKLPISALNQIIDLLEDLSEGRQVTIAPADIPVGTQVAAALLGVSRPWLTRLVSHGEIPQRARVRSGASPSVTRSPAAETLRNSNGRQRAASRERTELSQA